MTSNNVTLILEIIKTTCLLRAATDMVQRVKVSVAIPTDILQ